MFSIFGQNGKLWLGLIPNLGLGEAWNDRYNVEDLNNFQVIAGAIATWYFTRDKAALHMTVNFWPVIKQLLTN